MNTILSPPEYEYTGGLETGSGSKLEDLEMKPRGSEIGSVVDAAAGMNTTTSKNKRKSSQGMTTRIFHHAPAHSRGQSGRVIHDQLLCHAYAWHRGAAYGGACGSSEYKEHEELLTSIGLKEELPFACPGDYKREDNYRSSMIPSDKYVKDDTRIWIPEYVDFLRSRVQYPPKEPDKFTIAVHIKRGNVEPCLRTRDGFSRYLPNSHYQRLIDKYMQPGARVAIFSQESSYESLSEFEERGYELHIGHPTSEVWQTIVVADVVILSRSSFGLIPSLVTKGIVVYTPFWHKPLRNWHVVRDKDILNALDKDLAALNATCGQKKKYR